MKVGPYSFRGKRVLVLAHRNAKLDGQKAKLTNSQEVEYSHGTPGGSCGGTAGPKSENE